MKTKLILLPFSGKKIHSADCLKRLWDNGADFRIQGTTTYCSIRDLTNLQDYDTIILQDLSGNLNVTVKDYCANPLDNWL